MVILKSIATEIIKGEVIIGGQNCTGINVNSQNLVDDVGGRLSKYPRSKPQKSIGG